MAYLRIFVVHLVLLNHVSALRRAVIDDDVEIRPRLKLSLPVADRRQRNDDQKRSTDTIAKDVLHKTYALNCLSKTHLVSKNTVLSIHNSTVKLVSQPF